MKVGVLTSSRADYGIYKPLLLKLREDSYFEMEVIAFGSHLSKFHGYTVDEIHSDGFSRIHELNSFLTNDNEVSISTAYSLTALKFSEFWNQNKYDLVFCLGDRFEMNAAVQSGIPFGVKFAHIHGGETTLGAIDNIYRHQLTLASKIHLTATTVYSEKVESLIGDGKFVYTVGSLSLEGISNFVPREKDIFYKEYEIKNEPFALVTFHPETVGVENNKIYAEAMKSGLTKCLNTINLVITMPNADTMGSIYREKIYLLKQEFPEKVILIENFGKINYFTAMFYSQFLIGNTSSGIIEAASFGKYVVNVGDRQKGRLQSKNILNTSFEVDEIISNIRKAYDLGEYKGENVYFHEKTLKKIINIIKMIYEKL